MTQTDQEIIIIRCGAQTAVGDTAPLTAASIRAGINRITNLSYIEDSMMNPVKFGLIEYINEYYDIEDRFKKLTIPTLEEVVEPLARLDLDHQTIPLIIGLPEKRPGLPSDLEESIQLSINEAGQKLKLNFDIEFISEGHASGLIALEKAQEKLSTNQARFCIIGGVDSYLDEKTITWLDEIKRLYRSNNRNGFIPGEGCGFCLLTDQKTQKRNNLPALAKILAVGIAEEENTHNSPTPCLGLGVSETLRQVVTKMPPEQTFDRIYTSFNGERYHNNEFAYTAMRFGDVIGKPESVTAPFNCWGDLGAASGPLLINLATEAGVEGYANGPYNLILTSSLGKARAAALLELNQGQW